MSGALRPATDAELDRRITRVRRRLGKARRRRGWRRVVRLWRRLRRLTVLRAMPLSERPLRVGLSLELVRGVLLVVAGLGGPAAGGVAAVARGLGAVAAVKEAVEADDVEGTVASVQGVVVARLREAGVPEGVIEAVVDHLVERLEGRLE